MHPSHSMSGVCQVQPHFVSPSALVMARDDVSVHTRFAAMVMPACGAHQVGWATALSTHSCALLFHLPDWNSRRPFTAVAHCWLATTTILLLFHAGQLESSSQCQAATHSPTRPLHCRQMACGTPKIHGTALPHLFNPPRLIWVLCLVVTCKRYCLATVTQHTPAHTARAAKAHAGWWIVKR
jgi:hypothetical protein